MNTNFLGSIRNDKGISITEVLIVCAILFVMVGISIPYFANYTKLYGSDEQALKVIDLMQEASQRALNQRHNVRFEIDLTSNNVNIIDERTSGSDVLVKKVPLKNVLEVKVGTAPTGIPAPGSPSYANAVFATDSRGHSDGGTSVTGHTVWAGRFRSDGSVVNNSNAPVSANLYFWPPTQGNPNLPLNNKQVRSISMFGGTGVVRYWKYNGTTFKAY